ncbi:hypothetical protein F0241_14795 [Vibrio kanaloae]|uniref:hypothetical protein n=1 Tax=Vibrio kanaloae TaxID=170673 RepID=UPI00148D251B|nr:hypothetical protein [Vibrio kanaloae]NOI02359.1 hypothetical protein [Vibrio kanaloae]
MNKSSDMLILNGIDFLEKSLSEFKEQPKYSIIHFAISVEILLKARLAIEHWSLIVNKDPNKKKYDLGDFVSVNLDETVKRLRNVVGENISEAEYNSFKKIAAHRNRIIHFYHSEVDSYSGSTQKEVESIIKEQCECWYYIKSLFLNRWSKFFSEHTKRFHNLDWKMKRHAEYLSTIYEQKTEELSKLKKAGSEIVSCSYCSFKAVPLNGSLALLKYGVCKVCNFSHSQLMLECDSCDKKVTFINEGWGECPSCKKVYEHSDVYQLLDSYGYDHSSYPDNITPANCGSCEGYETVAAIEDKYLCVSCFDLFDNVGQCEWCHTTCTGDLSNSYWAGCAVCEGRSDYEKD